MSEKGSAGGRTGRLVGYTLGGLTHVLGATAAVALVSFPLFDRFTLSVLWQSMHTEVLDMSWTKIGLQVALGIAVYAIGMLMYSSWSSSKKKTRVVRRATGAVMVETLIVLVPFLALTSGIAQLSLLNIGAMLADVAVYQGARSAQIWSPESDLDRIQGQGDAWNIIVRERAKTASAVIMAPTAPSGFWIGAVEPDGSNDDFRRTRAALLGAFGNTGNMSEDWRARRSFSTGLDGSFALNVSSDIVGDSAFSLAFDQGGTAWLRASRKMTAAYMCFDKQKYRVVDSGGRVGVEFEYLYPILFPWFGYLFGEKRARGCYGRGGQGTYGNYHVMRRNFTLAKYPRMR